MAFSEEQIIKIANEKYHQGLATFDYSATNSALLVIDMQDEFVKPGWTSSWIPEATRQVPKIKALIDFCRLSNVPVIYTVFSKTHEFLDRPQSGSFMPNRFPELGSDPSWFTHGNIWQDLKPEAGEIIIHKSSYGAFFDTPLETILRNMKKETIIISGTLTNCCCGATARQGYERGFNIVMGADVTATYTEEMQTAELNALRFAFAKVQHSEEIMRTLASNR
ncbi:cysteine hydrolase [Chloroflexia bacterium SDU3-3]|nr:cysteine hydrolase [Chloroflexia bacterium SDU3-3]